MPTRPRVLTDLMAQEAILSRAGSGYGREQLVRLALTLACQDIRGPGVPVGPLVLDYLRAAEAALVAQDTKAWIEQLEDGAEDEDG